MILTFTPNPAVDTTLLVPQLRHGGQNRARASHLDPGGKGINASRIVKRLGRDTLALTILGGHVGRLLDDALADEQVPCRAVWVGAETRLNVVLVDDATGASTRVWDRGAAVPPNALADVEALLEAHLPEARVFLCAGTVPPGMDPGFYAPWIERARRAGVRTILDADGDTFLRGLEARPHLIKPNVREAETVLGRRLLSEDDVVRAAIDLLARGPEAVVLSMGASGSVLATAAGLVHAIPPKVERKSAVGSGDSLVGGLAVALHDDLPLAAGLRLGTAAGAATAMTEGTSLGTREEIEALLPAVTLRELTAGAT